MSLKKKLFTTITMFALVFSMVLVGVWAVSSDQVSFGGTITFTATNILATISGEVDGTASDPTLDDLEYTSAGGPSADALNSWNNNLTFKEDGSAFSIEITIQNDSSRKIYWSITDTVEANASISKTISTYTLGETNELAGNGTTTFTITIGLANGTNNSVSGSYGYQIDLKDESEYDPNVVNITNGHDYLTFDDFDEINNTVSVTDCAEGTIDVIIPAKVLKSGHVYEVTAISNARALGVGVFSKTKSTLKTISLPSTLTSIGTYAFGNCAGLTDVIIPDSVVSIGNYAFSGCTGLTSITIPESVTTIGISAFDCSNLKTVYLDSPTIAKSPSASTYLFENTDYVYIKTTITDISSKFIPTDNVDYDGYYKYTENIYE